MHFVCYVRKRCLSVSRASFLMADALSRTRTVREEESNSPALRTRLRLTKRRIAPAIRPTTASPTTTARSATQIFIVQAVIHSAKSSMHALQTRTPLLVQMTDPIASATRVTTNLSRPTIRAKALTAFFALLTRTALVEKGASNYPPGMYGINVR